MAAVSYTHLDVYKRQTNDNVRALDSNTDAGTYFGSRALAWMQVLLAWLMGA